MARLLSVVALLLLTATGSAASSGRTLGGYGVSVTLASGWHGVAGPGELQAADFPLPASALGSAQGVRVGRGHVHLVVWDYGPIVPYLANNFSTARLPLALTRRNLTRGGLEGFGSADSYAVRTVVVGGELLEFVADLGPKPLNLAALTRVNRLLATVRVQPPRIVRPRSGLLAADGVALRLQSGWSGRIELPVDRHTVRLVLRVHRGRVRLVLLELTQVAGAHADLPIRLGRRDLIRGRTPPIARLVFSSAGRGFDLSAVVPSPTALTQANQLLATLTAAPRPWTFRSCNLSLRLPGTWSAAINPRNGCYPVITLRGPGVRVLLTELRPGEDAAGRLLVRAGRRFRFEVTPTSGGPQANAVLATLKARPR